MATPAQGQVVGMRYLAFFIDQGDVAGNFERSPAGDECLVGYFQPLGHPLAAALLAKPAVKRFFIRRSFFYLRPVFR